MTKSPYEHVVMHVLWLFLNVTYDSSSENVLKLPDHGTVRKPEWGEWFTAESVTTVCGFTLISQNRGLYGRQDEVSSAGVY